MKPVTASIASFCLFMATWLMPVSVYVDVMHEPNFIHLNTPAFFLVTTCLVGFYIGALISNAFRIPTNRAAELRISPTIYVLIPLAASFFLLLVNSYLVIRNNPSLVDLLISGLGQKAKDDFEGQNTLPESYTLASALIWWVAAKIREDNAENSRNLSRLVRLLYTLTVTLAICNASVRLARYDLFPLLLGIYISGKSGISKAASTVKFFRALVLLGFIMAVFSIFSFVRGSETADDLLKVAFGYGPASYNRLAALVDGVFRYEYGDSYVYVLQFLIHIPLVSVFVDTQAAFGLPDFYTVWASEFESVSRAGLDANFIWSSTFGYVFSSIGFLSPFYFMVVGFICQFIWRLDKRGYSLGYVMLPWCLFCIIFWFGSNYFVYPKLLTIFIAGVLLTFYDWLLTMRAAIRRDSKFTTRVSKLAI